MVHSIIFVLIAVFISMLNIIYKNLISLMAFL